MSDDYKDNVARLIALASELDAELDGVSIPASAAAIVNAIRRVLDDLSDG